MMDWFLLNDSRPCLAAGMVACQYVIALESLDVALPVARVDRKTYVEIAVMTASVLCLQEPYFLLLLLLLPCRG